ncbi:DNA mismatch repair protein MutL [Aspergillus japonicus CBS 114.51]|uniref:DNA mismatch repair protein MutL n=1 Tax=Aspergillus japonicus CBS 114.51 TaxID=1448312 RepID=A0A8T8XEJ8_ASPJA|nr:DNA mismatch repair protein MutL [Aspergillus japonicus CBS 114.51]RAH86471.1 DNA mismatch repair protein MutL [Aspergillus japonicus CBS 114.51]
MDPDMEIDTLEPRGTKRPAEEVEQNDEPKKPKRIRALDPDVVNKIAAGEIIVAPMHALKELIENAVDAGSTSIEILIKDGGLKLLQITDNGHGIDRDDLPILCERFTTSKLKAFEDLTSIGTYGFRGEALASISHIAHLTVTTKTAGSSCAWKAVYSDGKLVPAKPGQSAAPKATAGRGGTQITVEDLFYNVPTRRRAFRSASEEYAKILDVVGRYSVHCAGVAFSCRKHGDSGVSISTPANASTIDRIRQIHGSAVANELVEFQVEDEKLGFRSSGLATNANYHVKRTVILLFINHRSVESTALKRAIEQTYSNFLPKGGHPFVYLDLEIEPQRVDVNVHPTKREVNFLNEDEIIESICADIRARLAQVDSSRTFLTQTLLPGVRTMAAEAEEPADDDDSTGGTTGAPKTPKTPATTKKPYEHNLVRTDSKVRKITSMLTPAAAAATTPSAVNPTTTTVLDEEGLHYETTTREPLRIALTSIKNLRAAVRSSMHTTLTETMAALTYVGLVDERRRIAAIQSGVKLYLVDYGLFSHEFFYQIGLTDFGNFGVITLDPAPQLIDLLRIAAEAEAEEVADHHPNTTSTSIPSNPAAAEIYTKAPEVVAQTLLARREMLNEYFSLQISADGALVSLPLLLKGYLPCLAKLPKFLLRLGPYVDWSSEEACFRGFLRELAAFYVPEPLPLPAPAAAPAAAPAPRTSAAADHAQPAGAGAAAAAAAAAAGEHTVSIPSPTASAHDPPTEKESIPQGTPAEETKTERYIEQRRAQIARMLEHVVFPAMRGRLVATTRLLGGVIEVADLKGLYRVFERC